MKEKDFKKTMNSNEPILPSYHPNSHASEYRHSMFYRIDPNKKPIKLPPLNQWM